jgi:NADPH-dependent F420 reductase
MRIAIIGGTGDLGMGLAVRLSAHYDILIGSRDPARAENAAGQAKGLSGGSVMGYSNADASARCDSAILAIPDLPEDGLLKDLAAPLAGKLVISPIVPMKFEGGHFSYSLREGSAAEKVALSLRSNVVAALHTVPAKKLLKRDERLDIDVLVAAENEEMFAQAAEIISSIDHLRPLYAGPLSVSRLIESMTPLLVNVERFSKMRWPSIRIV